MTDINVCIARIARGSYERCEIGSWLTQCFRYQNENLGMIWDVVVDMFGADTARNFAVAKARELECQFLFMIDYDMIPAPNFFQDAIEFLIDSPPCVYASPYRCAKNEIQVFTIKDNHPIRETETKTKGIEQVFSTGCGLIAFHMDVFKHIPVPYFQLLYSDDTHSQLVGTEDIFCTGRLSMAGIKVYVDYNNWSGHAKTVVM